MTTTFKDPIDFYNYTTNFYKSMPKTLDEGKDVMNRVQSVLKTEFSNMQDVFTTYAKAAKGDATSNEMSKASKKAIELGKVATFATFLSMPGALFALPLVLKKAKENNVDFVPSSVADKFNIELV